MRVSPTPRAGVIVFLLYLVVFYGVWVVTGVDYKHVGDDAGTLLKWYAAPTLSGAVLLVVATTYLGWWGPVLRENVRAPGWTLVPAALMVVLGVVLLASKDFSDTTGLMWVGLLLGSMGVGFSEETATRGVLLVGLRGKLTEPRAWLWSTALFGLLHLPNWVFGAGPSAVAQVFIAFLGGSTLYLVRRGTGSLVVAMLVHAFWDFANFAGKDGSPIGLLNIGFGALALVLALVLFRVRRSDDLAPPAAQDAAVV